MRRKSGRRTSWMQTRYCDDIVLAGPEFRKTGPGGAIRSMARPLEAFWRRPCSAAFSCVSQGKRTRPGVELAGLRAADGPPRASSMRARQRRSVMLPHPCHTASCPAPCSRTSPSRLTAFVVQGAMFSWTPRTRLASWLAMAVHASAFAQADIPTRIRPDQWELARAFEDLPFGGAGAAAGTDRDEIPGLSASSTRCECARTGDCD